MSCIPERGSQPTLSLFFLWVLSDCLAQERDCFCRMIQANFIDPQPEADAAHSGPQLAGGRQRPCGIVELGLSIIDKRKIDIRLGQLRSKLQDREILMDCIIKPVLLLCLLSSEKMFLNLVLDL